MSFPPAQILFPLLYRIFPQKSPIFFHCQSSSILQSLQLQIPAFFNDSFSPLILIPAPNLIKSMLFINMTRNNLSRDCKQKYLSISYFPAKIQCRSISLFPYPRRRISGSSMKNRNCAVSSSALAIAILPAGAPLHIRFRQLEFHTDHPRIRLKIYNHSTPQAIRALKNGEIDFAVVSTPPPCRVSTQGSSSAVRS